MRNDVHFPPAPGEEPIPTTTGSTTHPPHGHPQAGRVPAPPSRGAAVGGHGGGHPHPHPDRAHSLEKTSAHAATDLIYETPEDRGGIDSLTLSIVVVAGVAIALLIIAYLFFRHLG